ncbi:unnamed protein product [Amoebophrya sp. A25]|nr:unnamed protein product [Amoebophrya sp. A25]|eukprot:GSA25T00021421001.1
MRIMSRFSHIFSSTQSFSRFSAIQHVILISRLPVLLPLLGATLYHNTFCRVVSATGEQVSSSVEDPSTTSYDIDAEGTAKMSSAEEFFSSFPRVIIGCWQLLERDRNPEKAVETIVRYQQSGFHYFDTADIYGPSEELLGHARAVLEDAVLEQQKTGTENNSTGEGAVAPFHVFTKYVPSNIRESADRINTQSRKALFGKSKIKGTHAENLPPLELVQFHWWDFDDGGHIAHAKELMRLQGQQKIRHLAVTNFDVKHLQQLIDVQYPVTVNQVQFSLLDRRAENGMLQLAKKQKFKLACFGSVAGGWLSEKYLNMPEDPMSQRSFRSGATISLQMYRSSLDSWGDWKLFQELLSTLDMVAKKYEKATIAMIAAWWVLQKLETEAYGGAVIIGVRDPRHLEETRRIRDGPAVKKVAEGGKNTFIAEEDMATIAKVLAKGRMPVGEDIWSRERG